MVALVSERRQLLLTVALVVVAALAVSCGGSSKAEPTATASPEATARLTPLPTTPPASGISTLTFVDAQQGWAIGECSDVKGSTGCTILATSDGGKTWHAQYRSTGRVQILQFLDAQNGFALGTGDGLSIIATTDGGSSWKPRDLGKNLDLTAIEFATPQQGFALGSGVIFQTTDGGQTWVFNYGSLTCSFSSIALPTADEGWAGGSGPTGPCLFKTTDGGRTWQVSFVGAESPSVEAAFVQSTLFGRLADPAQRISQFNRNCFVTSLDFYNAREARLHIACDHMGMGMTLTTDNGGASWEYASEQGECLMGCQTYRYQSGAGGPVFYLDLLHVWQRTAHQEISRSVDGGKTWDKVEAPELCCDADSIFFVDPDHGWITFGESIALTDDGGRTWDRLPVAIVP